MVNIKKLLSNPWAISILSPILVAIIISIYTALSKKINFLDALQLLSKTFFAWIISFFTFSVPIYIILIVLILLLIALKIYVEISEVKTNNSPKWLTYTKTHYKNWIIRWEYRLDYNNKYHIENLRPICQCGCELTVKDRYKNTYYSIGIFVCPKCGNTYPPLEDDTLEDFNKILFHDINTENYPHNS